MTTNFLQLQQVQLIVIMCNIIQVERQLWTEQGPITRATSTGRLIEQGTSCLSQKTCINDAVRLWNKLPATVTDCISLSQIKKQAKLFAKELPV